MAADDDDANYSDGSNYSVDDAPNQSYAYQGPYAPPQDDNTSAVITTSEVTIVGDPNEAANPGGDDYYGYAPPQAPDGDSLVKTVATESVLPKAVDYVVHKAVETPAGIIYLFITVVEISTGPGDTPFPGGHSSYQAGCSGDHNGASWGGPQRDTQDEAQDDLNQHQYEWPGHSGGVGSDYSGGQPVTLSSDDQDLRDRSIADGEFNQQLQQQQDDYYYSQQSDALADHVPQMDGN